MDNPTHPDPKQELPPPPEEKLLRAPTFWEAHGKLVTGVIVGVLVCVAAFSAWIIYMQSAKPVPEATMMTPTVPTQVPSPTTNPLIPTIFNGVVPEEEASASTALSPTAPTCSQEVQVCPDGSYVGRTGPNCEFTPCSQ